MSTRSVLGVEQPNGKIYCQYVHSDGYPSGNGKDYYTDVISGFSSIGTNGQEVTQELRLKRIKCYLNEAQYRSVGGIDNHWTEKQERWFSFNANTDIAWKYTFMLNGDFIILKNDPEATKITIPWSITENIFNEYKFRSRLREHTDWWEAIGYEDLEENKKVLSWKDPALHINDELHYESSRLLRDQRLKGEKVTLPKPLFIIESGNVFAFPEQKNEGYRDYGVLKIGTTQKFETIKDTFSDWEGTKKKNKDLSATYK